MTKLHQKRIALLVEDAEYVDQEVCVDKNLISSRMPDDLPAFMKEVIRFLSTHENKK